jgi:hypothetical protein
MRLTMYSQHKFLSVEPGPFLVTKVVVQNVSRWRLLQAFFTGILKGAWPPTRVLLILLMLPVMLYAQEEEKVTVPKRLLTQQQLEQMNGGNLRQNVSAWAGIGKEVGEAVNSSMQAITTQSNNFAQTGVGKMTMAIVVWKIFGDQLIHILGGVVETILFVPLWIWSFRKTCITRSIRTGKDTYEKIVYNASGEMTPRIAHALAAAVFAIVVLTTVFSY